MRAVVEEGLTRFVRSTALLNTRCIILIETTKPWRLEVGSVQSKLTDQILQVTIKSIDTCFE